jgi:dynein heavy chain
VFPPCCLQDYITTLPATDRPEAFGQHPNAEISYLIEDSKVCSAVLTAPHEPLH